MILLVHGGPTKKKMMKNRVGGIQSPWVWTAMHCSSLVVALAAQQGVGEQVEPQDGMVAACRLHFPSVMKLPSSERKRVDNSITNAVETRE